jgi:hypothetical protein
MNSHHRVKQIPALAPHVHAAIKNKLSKLAPNQVAVFATPRQREMMASQIPDPSILSESVIDTLSIIVHQTDHPIVVGSSQNAFLIAKLGDEVHITGLGDCYADKFSTIGNRTS